MARHRLLVFALLFTASIFSIASRPAAAQELQSGTWTGFVLPPNGEEMEVTFEVTSTADSLAIQLMAGPMGSFNLDNIELTSDELAFTFSPGPVVYCFLKKKSNGSYEGPCAPDGDEEGILVMNPPKDNN